MIALLAATWLGTLLSVFFILIALLLVFMVVITPSNEGGMAAAFGGMGGDSFFGTKANQHINKFTVFLAVSFLVLALGINLTHSRGSSAAGDGDGKPARTPEEQKMDDLAPKAPETPPAPGGLVPPAPEK